MKPNHYGQGLAGFRVLCVLCCCAFLHGASESAVSPDQLPAERAGGGADDKEDKVLAGAHAGWATISMPHFTELQRPGPPFLLSSVFFFTSCTR